MEQFENKQNQESLEKKEGKKTLTIATLALAAGVLVGNADRIKEHIDSFDEPSITQLASAARVLVEHAEANNYMSDKELAFLKDGVDLFDQFEQNEKEREELKGKAQAYAKILETSFSYQDPFPADYKLTKESLNYQMQDITEDEGNPS